MKKTFQLLEFDKIIEKLKEYAYTTQVKEKFDQMKPYLAETELQARIRETTEARLILDKIGTPTLISMQDIQRILEIADKGGMLVAEELEYIARTLKAMERLKDFLNRCKQIQVGIAYYADEIMDLEETRKEIERCIKDGRIDDYASSELRETRRSMMLLEEKIKNKAEAILASNKKLCSESFLSYKSGHICLPIKKNCKSKIEGSVIDQSRSGDTLFIQPTQLTKLTNELDILKTEEENEEIKILYTLTASLTDVYDIFIKNKKIVEDLDYVFAKGKLSLEMQAIEPKINTKRTLDMKQARHPLLKKEECVPLDFTIGKETKGIVITGPNTGGKTVCIKTIGLLSLMAGCGLHVPCEEADICMNNHVLCDIGDGQDLTQNLSTFSAHIANILDILSKTNEETLVLLDELGSGTDPTEGMGIAISILEELRKRNCLFVATTHYPEVKQYAQKTEGIINARMAFNRKSLKPLYQLEMGKAGESQALYIAKKLGMPKEMMIRAYQESYHQEIEKELIEQAKEKMELIVLPRIQKKKIEKEESKKVNQFHVGDSVFILPEKNIAIVCKQTNEKGEVLVQRKKEKFLVNHKRLQLNVPANMLYPEDYDFSILFDSVENRKKRHEMERKYSPDLEINYEE